MKKWRNLTDDEADEELRQIALERQILEDSYTGDTGADFGEEGDTGAEGEEVDFGDDDIEDTELPSDVSVENALKELEELLNGI